MNEKKWRIYAVRKLGLIYHVRRPGCWYVTGHVCSTHQECVAFRHLDRAFAHIKEYEEQP